MTALIDTTALLALLDGRHPEHFMTRHEFALEIDMQDRIAVTDYVVVETIDLARRRLGAGAVKLFVRDVLPALEVEWVQPADHALAVEILLASQQQSSDPSGSDEQSLSLVDCTTFVVARRLGVSRCISLDERFIREGLE